MRKNSAGIVTKVMVGLRHFLKLVYGTLHDRCNNIASSFFARNFHLPFTEMLEKRSQIFDTWNLIFVKSIRHLTEVKETEKFMDANICEFGKRSF